jgi:hypothetical protein
MFAVLHIRLVPGSDLDSDASYFVWHLRLLPQSFHKDVQLTVYKTLQHCTLLVGYRQLKQP